MLQRVLAVERRVLPDRVQAGANRRRGQAGVIVLDRGGDIAQHQRRVAQSVVDLRAQRSTCQVAGLLIPLESLLITLELEQGRGGVIVGNRLAGCPLDRQFEQRQRLRELPVEVRRFTPGHQRGRRCLWRNAYLRSRRDGRGAGRRGIWRQVAISLPLPRPDSRHRQAPQ